MGGRGYYRRGGLPSALRRSHRGGSPYVPHRPRRRHRAARRSAGDAPRLAPRPSLLGQAPLPPDPRRHGHDPVRRVQGERPPRDVRGGGPPAAGDEPLRHGDREAGRALAHRLRARRARPARLRPPRPRVSDRAQGPRRRVPDGAAPPLAALPAAAGDPARPPHGREGDPRLLRRARVHSRRRADLHAFRVRGTSTLFEVPYFDLGKAYLTQSGQLYMEAAAMALGKVYCFGPTFRAEKSKTRRHLTEFWMVEPEVAYMDLDGDMALMEEFVSYVIGAALAKHEQELAGVLERDVSRLREVKPPFPRITYGEAVEVIRTGQRALAAEGKRDPAAPLMEWGEDIGGDEETLVAAGFDRPVMVHRYPAELKAFYFKKDPADAKVALGCDVLAPEGYGEIIGGGQREDDLATLEAAIADHRLPAEAFEWYLDLRRYGSVPHAGFGMGVERCVAWICGLHHVRETIPFARMMERITP